MSELEKLRKENARLKAEITALSEDLILSEEGEIARRELLHMDAIIRELYDSALDICKICEAESFV